MSEDNDGTAADPTAADATAADAEGAADTTAADATAADAEGAAWQQKRRAAADERLAALDRRKAAETEQAAAHVAAFVREAQERQLPTTRLRAGSLNGRGSYRTSLEGWYIKRNQTLAIGVDGNFYIMSASGSLTARVTGVVVHPSDPPLIVGAGGRDGESMAMADLLQQRLDAGAEFPA